MNAQDVWDAVIDDLMMLSRGKAIAIKNGVISVEVKGDRFIVITSSEISKQSIESTPRIQRVMGTLTNKVFDKVLKLDVIVEPESNERFEADPPPSALSLYGLITMYDMLNKEWPKPKWLIQGILPTGLTVFAGRQKIGKSWMCLQMMKSLVSGSDFLSKTVERGNGLYLALEDTPSRLQNRMVKQGWAFVDDSIESHFMLYQSFSDKIGDINGDGAGVLAELIRIKKYDLVIIDTFSKSIRGDQNNVDDMTIALSPLHQVAHLNDCAIVLVDHHRKFINTDDDFIMDVMGSTAKAAIADNIVGLYRTRGQMRAKFLMGGRDVEEDGKYVKFDSTRGIWVLEGEINDLDITERRQEIIGFLTDMGPSTCSNISQSLNQNRGNTYTRLSDMVNSDLIERYVESGKILFKVKGDDNDIENRPSK